MKQKTEELIEIIAESFDSLEECVNYYTDILSRIRECLDKELLTKREYRSKKRFIMEQWKRNERLIKKKGEHQRNTEKQQMKERKHSTLSESKTTYSPKLPPKDQAQLEPAKEGIVEDTYEENETND